jgi:Uma2 family endonuclease
MDSRATKRQKLMTVSEYLAFEECSEVRHEFIGGEVHAFAGTTVRHNRIALNLATRFMRAVDEGDCGVMVSDVKLRVHGDVFYYPDVMVVCDKTDTDPLIKTRPCVVVEVLSDSTRMTDIREKLMFYRQVDSLDTYLIVEQNEPKVHRHWRDDERLWWSETISNERTIPIPCLGIDLTLEDFYRGLPEAGDS